MLQTDFKMPSANRLTIQPQTNNMAMSGIQIAQNTMEQVPQIISKDEIAKKLGDNRTEEEKETEWNKALAAFINFLQT